MSGGDPDGFVPLHHGFFMDGDNDQQFTSREAYLMRAGYHAGSGR